MRPIAEPYPGIAGERTVEKVRELAVVPARKIEADLCDVVPDHVEVVEQPLSGRTDVQRRRLGGDPRVRLLEDGESPVEPAQERPDAPSSARGPEVLMTGDGAGVLGETLGTQELAPDRTGEKVGPGVPAPERADHSSPGHGAARPQHQPGMGTAKGRKQGVGIKERHGGGGRPTLKQSRVGIDRNCWVGGVESAPGPFARLATAAAAC
jgi:hypothetical protein